MFRPARWRSEKNKIKAVFKLQFHATQVTGFDALMISVIPADVGKPTSKLEKATVCDGSCYWENPVCETVKFDRESKSGKIHEKIYRFVVAMGSSRAGVVGEASIDFSIYAEATKISALSLPLKNSKSEILLHVSIQRLQDSEDHREVEESENAKVNFQDRSLRAQLGNGEMNGIILSNSLEDGTYNKTIPQNGNINGNCRTSSGSDITLSSSNSSSGLDTPRELQIKVNSIPQDPTSMLSSLDHASGPTRPISEVPKTISDEHQRSKWGWMGASGVEASTDDSSSTPREGFPRMTSLEALDDDVEKLKSELTALARQAEVSELELHTLRRQIVKESKKGHDLSREVTTLKKERDSLREECEKLKSGQKRHDDAKAKNMLQLEGGDLQALVEELRQELNYEKDLNANLRIQLEKTQESNSELILAVRDLDEMLEQKNTQMLRPSNKSSTDDGAEKLRQANFQYEEDDDEEQKALEQLVREHSGAKDMYLLERKIMDLQGEIEIYRREKDELEVQMEQIALDYEILKQENHDMTCKLDQSRLQETLKLQYECTSSYATVHELEAKIDNLEKELKMRDRESTKSMDIITELENHVKDLEEELEKQAQGFEAKIDDLENELKKREKESAKSMDTITELEKQAQRFEAKIDNLENELKKCERESAKSMNTITELENHIKDLEEELEKQAQGFEADIETVTRAKVEQEQRAIRAEDTLRKTRQQNASTAERLQEEFRRLSIQMASTFEANEKLATKALMEANELRLHKINLEEVLQKANDELESLKDQYEARLLELSGRNISLSKQIELLQSEFQDKSMKLENQKRCAEETHRLLSQEIVSLKADAEILSTEKKSLSELADRKEILTVELERMQESIKEMELLIEQGNSERINLENRVADLKKEAEDSHRELNQVRHLEREKESMLANLQAEVSTLKSQCDELRHSLHEENLEKEKLMKQVSHLKGDLKKKDDALKNMEKKLKDGNGRAAASDIAKPTAKTNKSHLVPFGAKEIANLKEKIRLLESQIKLKEAALETSTNSFLEKERDLQHKIEELEKSLEVLHQNSTSVSECIAEKVPTKDGGNDTAESDCLTSSLERSDDENPVIEESKASGSSSRDIDELLNEMASLKDKNKLMEDELKEMQGRYSEISLKFAEVEGERQQLVMRLRNIKNAKKSS